MQLSVKNVDDDIFRHFKAESVRHGLSVGPALTLAMQSWLARQPKKPQMSLLHFQPQHFGKDTQHMSEEIDSLLYD